MQEDIERQLCWLSFVNLLLAQRQDEIYKKIDISIRCSNTITKSSSFHIIKKMAILF